MGAPDRPDRRDRQPEVPTSPSRLLDPGEEEQEAAAAHQRASARRTSASSLASLKPLPVRPVRASPARSGSTTAATPSARRRRPRARTDAVLVAGPSARRCRRAGARASASRGAADQDAAPQVPVTRADGDRRRPRSSGDAECVARRRAKDDEQRDDLVERGAASCTGRWRARRLPAPTPAIADPHGADVAIRIGYGDGDALVDGRWEQAIEVPHEARPRVAAPRPCALRSAWRRSWAAATRRSLRGAVLRASADLDGERGREAALQLRVGLEALLAERDSARLGTARRRTWLSGRAAPGDRRGGQRGAPRRPLSPSAQAEVAETLARLRARPAPPRGARLGRRLERRQHGAELVDHVAVQPHGRVAVVRRRALGDDREAWRRG